MSSQSINSSSIQSFADSQTREPQELISRVPSVVSYLKNKLSQYSSREAAGNLEDNARDEDSEPFDEGELRRAQTRATIISTLEDRLYLQQSKLDVENTYLNEKNRFRATFEDIGKDDALPTLKDGLEFQKIDPDLVTWDSDDDPENPKNWKHSRKWRSTAVVSVYTLLAPFASTMLSPAVSIIAQDFHSTSQTVNALMVSIYILSWALFSPFVAPLSEMYGRRHVLNISCWALLIFNIACAVSQNTVQMCVFRLFAGIGGASPMCIGIGVLSDLFDTKDIGVANAIYGLGPTLGPCVSALIAGFIVDRVHWRWCFWVLAITNGIVAAVGTLLLEETYTPALLKKKAARLRKETGNQHYHSLYEIANGESTFDKFYLNLRRPVEMLVTNPIVFGLGVFMAITYGCLYIIIVGFPAVFSNVYGLSKSMGGLMYVALLLGYLTATLTTHRITEAITRHYNRENGVHRPEYTLVWLLQSGIVLPVGLFWFGWAAQTKQNYIFTAVGAGIFAYGIIAVFLCIVLYLVEMNPRFSASSLAATSIFRCLLGFAFPLFATQLFDKVGYGWGCSMFAFICIAAGIPFPLYLIMNGEKLRNYVNDKTERQQAARDIKNLEKLRIKEEKKLLKQQAKAQKQGKEVPI